MKSLIIDCDPGCDDAIAILVALKYANRKAITTVNGNVSVVQYTVNALMTLALADANTPVHSGARHPMNGPFTHNDFSHGTDGLGGMSILGGCTTIGNYWLLTIH